MDIEPRDDNNLKNKVEKEFYKKYYNKFKSRAAEYIHNKEKASSLLNNAISKSRKISQKGPMSDIWDKIVLIFNLLRDWINGSYREVSIQTISMIIIGLLYFVMPLDIIPDFIPGLGIVDDAFILGLLIKQIGNDLEKYRMQKEKIHTYTYRYDVEDIED